MAEHRHRSTGTGAPVSWRRGADTVPQPDARWGCCGWPGRVAVLCRGRLLASGPVPDFDQRTIVKLMTSPSPETVTT